MLPWSIASVRAQTFSDWELWVIGDGCTDDSAAVVSSIADPRVRWVNLPVNGRTQAGPNNEALRRAVSGYQAYLGHDDLWLPEHLEVLVGALDAGASFAVARQLRIDPGRAPYLAPEDGYAYEPGHWLSPTATMHRVHDVRAVGGWRPPAATGTRDPESDLWARLTEHVGPPRMLEAVTSVKFPAALRQGVYRDRPSDEQATWWARVCDAPDSASFVAEALRDHEFRPPDRYDPSSVPPELVDASMAAIERQRISRAHRGLDA